MKNLTSAIKTSRDTANAIKTSRDTAKTNNNNNNESSAVTLTSPACKYKENKLPSPNPNITKQFNYLTYNIAYMSFIVPNALNSAMVKLDAPLTPASKNVLRALKTGETNLLLITSAKLATPSITRV